MIHIHGSGIFNSLIHKRLLDKGLKVAVTVHGILSVEQRNAISKKFSVKRLLQYKYQTHFERKMLNRCKCVIVDTGYVDKMPSAYLEKMERLKSSMRNGDRVSICPNIERSKLLELYSKAFLFALHSEEDSQGIVFAEAMASGLPIAATRVGGIPYVVKDQVNGLLCDYGDVNGYAENMRRLLNDRVLCERLAANNLKEARSYDWGNIADAVVKVYEGMF